MQPKENNHAIVPQKFLGSRVCFSRLHRWAVRPATLTYPQVPRQPRDSDPAGAEGLPGDGPPAAAEVHQGPSGTAGQAARRVLPAWQAELPREPPAGAAAGDAPEGGAGGGAGHH